MRTLILLLALLPLIATAQKASKGSLRDSALVVTNEQDAAALAAFAGATNTLHAAITNEALYRAQADAAALAATHSATGALAEAQAATNAAVSLRITVSHTNLLEHFTAVLLAESYARGTNVTAWADFILSDTRASNALNRAQTAAAWQSWLGTNTYVKAEQDAAALSAISVLSTQGLARVHDTAQPSRYFQEVVNGTGTVFEVTGPFTNLMVTLSDDFEETVTHTRPAWTNNVFPFTEGQWVGGVSENTEGNADYYYIESSAGTTVIWSDTTETLPASLTLVFGDGAGTATVSVGNIYYTTNAIKHFSTKAELEAAKAACGVVLTNTVNEAVSNLTADITSATNALMPYARTLYGDVSTTNEAGYAAFNTTNAAASSYSVIVPTSFIGSNTNTLRYRFNSLRKFGVLTNTAWFVKSGFGAGIKSVSTLVSVKDASGNVISQSSSQPVYLSDSSSPSSVTNVFTMPDNVYSGTVEVACIAASTNASFAVLLYSGAQYTNLLTFSEAPTPYATHTELRALRAEIPAIVLSNSVSQMIVWTNTAGAATNMAWRENGTWHTTAFGGGAALNNLDVYGDISIGGDTTYNTWRRHLYQAVYPDYPNLYAQGLDMDNAGNRVLVMFHAANDGTGGIVFKTGVRADALLERMRIATASGDITIAKSLSVAGTNTAAEVRTLGGYSIFDSGSNCYWRVTASNGTFYASDTNGVRKFKFTTETP